MPKKTPKKTTLENLAKKMDEGFKRANQRMNEGFKRADQRMNEGFKRADQRMDEKIDQLALAVKNGFDENTRQHQQIFNRIDNLERGQEEIKLRLDGVAYRFEVQELDRRLKKVEAKLKIK